MGWQAGNWLARMFSRDGFSVSIDVANSTFLYRERGRRMQISGEAMAQGYAVYASSIRAWEPERGHAPTDAPVEVLDETERQRIASNVCRYLSRRGECVYLAR